MALRCCSGKCRTGISYRRSTRGIVHSENRNHQRQSGLFPATGCRKSSRRTDGLPQHCLGCFLEYTLCSTVLCNRRPHQRRVDTDCRTSLPKPSRTGNGKPLAAEESLIESSGDAPATACDVNQLSYVNIGDTLTTEETVSLKLDALSTQNTFAGISTDSIGRDCDYSRYQNADGTIADNTRTWYSYGDGVNTLDEVIKTETIPQTILTFQLTYTNNGTEAVETCVCPQLFRMQADGTFPAYTAEAEGEYSVDSCDLNITGEFFLVRLVRQPQQKITCCYSPAKPRLLRLPFWSMPTSWTNCISYLLRTAMNCLKKSHNLRFCKWLRL